MLGKTQSRLQYGPKIVPLKKMNTVLIFQQELAVMVPFRRNTFRQ